MTRSIPIPEIEITQDMIKYSMPGDCCACAISLTILENTDFILSFGMILPTSLGLQTIRTCSQIISTMITRTP